MDNSKINTVEWFFGYGGNHLGLRRVIPGMQLVAACEIEGYAAANMVSKMEAGLLDAAPIWTDCKTFPNSSFHGLVDLFIASYPCQGFSCAGKREGSRDPRFLWPWVFRFVCEARPRVVFFENVEGHVSLGLSTVISDLEEAGYRVEAGIFSAAEVGAAHRRKRVFILGYDKGERGGEGRAECPGWLGQCASKQSSNEADAECAERRTPTRPPGLADGEEGGRDEGASGLGERSEALWPTPQAHDCVGGKTPEQVATMRARTGAGVSNLNESVMLWPTPHANCSTGAGTKGTGGPNLQTQVAWATPAARDWRDSRASQATMNWTTPIASELTKMPKTHGKGGQIALNRQVFSGQAPPPGPESPSTPGSRQGSSKLSADWVEALMDVPPMWTDCGC